MIKSGGDEEMRVCSATVKSDHQEEGSESGGKSVEQEDSRFNPSSSDRRKEEEPIKLKVEDRLESARIEMGVVREENEKLKLWLSQIVKDYQSLKRQFNGIIQQEEEANDKKPSQPPHSIPIKLENIVKDEGAAEAMTFLTLGRTPTSKTAPKAADQEAKRSFNLINIHGKDDDDDDDGISKDEFKLGLVCEYETDKGINNAKSNDDSMEEEEEKEDKEELPEMWPPSKVLKTVKGLDDEANLQQPQLKKARVSVRARCETPTMNDGCQWRKYGQKIAKGNPCPRAYYRCTASPSCPVRKQVQRCIDDMSILITTYEGNHNHPLPTSAAAMASTTSAAVSMLQSQSSTSQSTTGGARTSTVSPSSMSTTSANLYGLNFSITQTPKPNQIYFPNSSISTYNAHPTITLDLTTPSSSSNNYDRFSSNFSSLPRYSSPSNSLNYSSSSTHFTSLNYGTHPINNIGALNLGKQANQEHWLQPPQHSLTDKITAATKAIATNPSFKSALAAALTSCVGGGSSRMEESSGINGLIRWNDSSSASKLQLSSQNRAPWDASYLNIKTVTLDSQRPSDSFSLFPTSLSLSTSKSGSGPSPT